MWKRTPAARRRCSQARSSGAAFMSVGKHAARGADEGLDAEAVRPVAQRLGPEGAQQRLDLRAALAEAAGEALEGLGVREVQAARAGQQELAADRGHGVVQMHLHALRAQHFGRHQPGRAAADDGDTLILFHSSVTSSPCPVRKAARTVSPG